MKTMSERERKDTLSVRSEKSSVEALDKLTAGDNNFRLSSSFKAKRKHFHIFVGSRCKLKCN